MTLALRQRPETATSTEHPRIQIGKPFTSIDSRLTEEFYKHFHDLYRYIHDTRISLRETNNTLSDDQVAKINRDTVALFSDYYVLSEFMAGKDRIKRYLGILNANIKELVDSLGDGRTTRNVGFSELGLGRLKKIYPRAKTSSQLRNRLDCPKYDFSPLEKHGVVVDDFLNVLYSFKDLEYPSKRQSQETTSVPTINGEAKSATSKLIFGAVRRKFSQYLPRLSSSISAYNAETRRQQRLAYLKQELGRDMRQAEDLRNRATGFSAEASTLEGKVHAREEEIMALERRS